MEILVNRMTHRLMGFTSNIQMPRQLGINQFLVFLAFGADLTTVVNRPQCGRCGGGLLPEVHPFRSDRCDRFRGTTHMERGLFKRHKRCKIRNRHNKLPYGNKFI